MACVFHSDPVSPVAVIREPESFSGRRYCYGDCSLHFSGITRRRTRAAGCYNRHCQPRGTGPEKRVSAAAHLFIKEYRVRGVHKLRQIEVEEAVYPFLGSGRGPEDIEQARAALEKAYQAKGYQTVSVSVPSQRGRSRHHCFAGGGKPDRTFTSPWIALLFVGED